MIIAVDFDGTVVKHNYPAVGADVPGAVEVLKKLVAQGHQLILWTMRGDEALEDAVNWYKKYEIPLFGINTNPQQKEWTNSPKAYAVLYIDDAALGCPLDYILVQKADGGVQQIGRPFVNWTKVEQMLIEQGILEEETPTP